MNETLIGLGACVVSSVCFGSMYVAIRKFDGGDGIFVQWMVCTGIFIVGIIINLAEGIPQFEPLAMLGGFLWAVGNLTALPIIRTIGLAMGMLIWGTTNCVVGWATGRFGLFGIRASVPADPLLNYIGLALVIIGGILFALVKPTVYDSRQDSSVENNENTSLVEAQRQVFATISNADSHAGSSTNVIMEIADDTNSVSLKPRFMAIVVSILAGCCYGLNFIPIIYIQEHSEKFDNPPREEIKYTFSHFTGVFLTSTFVFIIYLAYTQNKPFVNSKIIAPSLLAGLLWSVAQIAWFISNDKLSQAITFPIDGMVPGIIASLWSVFYFKEIKGSKNLQILTIATIITLVGASLVGVSKTI